MVQILQQARFSVMQVPIDGPSTELVGVLTMNKAKQPGDAAVADLFPQEQFIALAYKPFMCHAAERAY